MAYATAHLEDSAEEITDWTYDAGIRLWYVLTEFVWEWTHVDLAYQIYQKDKMFGVNNKNNELFWNNKIYYY